MKLQYRIFLTVSIIAMIFLLFAACNDSAEKEDKVKLTETFFQEFVADDSKALSDSLTNAYSLQELRTFFSDCSVNEDIGFGKSDNVTTFTISEVNQQFPIEVLRTNGYTVYRVDEGGYFYVFWSESFSADSDAENPERLEPIVYFTAYLSSPMETDAFDVLEDGVSTAQDVYLIDESFELSFLVSNGIYSYSILDDNSIMQIEYISGSEIKDRNDLTVKGKTVCPRETVQSSLASILSEDLPY